MKNELIPQIYGYTVCLISLLAFMFTLPTGIGSYLKYANPSIADGAPQILTTPYEKWRTDFLKKLASPVQQPDSSIILVFKAVPPTEMRLREIYNEQIASQLEASRLHFFLPLMKQVIVFILSIALFLYHWRWLKRKHFITMV
jgi:hypothetical protein